MQTSSDVADELINYYIYYTYIYYITVKILAHFICEED